MYEVAKQVADVKRRGKTFQPWKSKEIEMDAGLDGIEIGLMVHLVLNELQI